MLKLAKPPPGPFMPPEAAISELERVSATAIPLCWAAASRDQGYLNLGDALSPVMVAAIAGKRVWHASSRSPAPRMSAVGTIGHGLQGGQVWVWGTGSSAWRNPLARDSTREPYVTPPDTTLHVCATRGPVSWRLLTGAAPDERAVFGDPVWLLPRYFQPPPGKTAELGVILHLAELADRATEAHPKPGLRRYDVPPVLDGSVRLLNTVTDISAAALRRRLEEILACKRLISTSLHGLVFAESYGIPCLYFTALPGRTGLRHVRLGPQDQLNLRMSDLYSGLGEKVIPVYNQPKDAPTDWAAVMAAIDKTWRPKQLDEARLLDAFPLPRGTLPPAPGGLFEHPFLTGLPFQHDTPAGAGVPAPPVPPRALVTIAPRTQDPVAPRAPASVAARPPASPVARARGAGASPLHAAIAAGGAVPLAWAGSTTKMNYLNFGDALSPVMVTLCSGLKVRRVPFKSSQPRLAAVGTIGHGMEGGAVWFWGTGASSFRNPGASAEERVAYAPPPDTDIHLAATRGPVSASLLGGAPARAGAVFGDPVWLLPRFHPVHVAKRYELGVILHLSELADRALDAHPLAKYRRYDVSGQGGSVRLINTITPISAAGLRDKLDEILACKRIVSTSLHGMVIAESYGIPCLYFPPTGTPGLQQVNLTPDGDIDLRIVDLYLGLGVSRLPVYVQDRLVPTDWDRLIAAIDRSWQPRTLDADALLHALPLPVAPLAAPPGATVFEHELIRETEFQHDVVALLRDDRAATDKLPAPRVTTASTAPAPAPAASPVVVAAPASLPRGYAVRRGGRHGLHDLVAELEAVPLCWVAPTRDYPYPNLGDALSAVMVAGLAGLPVTPRNFDDVRERLAAVGTIGHSLRRGHVHVWGTGLDATRMDGPPPDTAVTVHAVRGPYTAAVLHRYGVDAPPIYGDPVWLLPRLLPRVAKPPRFELGVIVHISELQEATAASLVKAAFVRYRIPPSLSRSIRIINTYTNRSIHGLISKIDEILDCKRIASTSFHGILIGDTYDIPSVWFGTSGHGGDVVDTASPEGAIDHRVRDFYAACRETNRAVYRADRGHPTDWEALIDWIDHAWTPPEFDAEPLLEAFPMMRAVDPAASVWPMPLNALRGLV